MTLSALRRKTTRVQRNRTIHGITFTKTPFGWTAQGLQLDQVEDTSTYWTTTLPGNGGEVDGKTLAALVETLIEKGHLKVGEGS